MADTQIAVRSGAPGLSLRSPAEPAARGRLQIEAKVYSQIARQAASEVPGVVRRSVTLGALTGRNLPRALADSDSRHPVITLEIAVGWPASAAEVCADVQEHVADVLTTMTGRRPARVDVDVVEVAQSERLLLTEEVSAIVAAQHDLITEESGGRLVPRGYPGAGVLAGLLGVLMVAAAVVTAREYAVVQGHYSSDDWLADATRWISETTWQAWMAAVAVAAVVVGLWMLFVALTPRARTHRRLSSAPGLWTRDVDIARRLSAIALERDTTVAASTSVKRGRAMVSVHGQPDADFDRLDEQLTDALRALEKPPRVQLDLHRSAALSTPRSLTTEDAS